MTAQTLKSIAEFHRVIKNYLKMKRLLKQSKTKGMRETMFKVLIFAGQYVNETLLEKGIYASHRPRLYSKDATIENIEEQARLMTTITGDLFVSERYFINLRKCKLVDISLICNI